MNKTYCDRCGAVIERKQLIHWDYLKMYTNDDFNKYYDICLKCHEEIKEFIEHPFEFEAKMILKLQEEKKHE